MRGLFFYDAALHHGHREGRDAIRQARTAAEVDADLVELRLDSMTSPDPEAALADRRKPAIVTCRPLREGGMFDGSEEERLRILERAQALGAEFVDIEWDVPVEPFLAARGGRGVIVSRHDFQGVPDDLPALLHRLRAAGGEVAKVAVTVERASDLRRLLENARPDEGSVLIGMGRAGLATRVLAGRFGSRWTYAGNGVAPGQVSAARLLQEFRFRRIRPDAAVYALLGRPVVNSLSPAMHNAGFAALGLNAVYVPIESRDIAEFQGARRAARDAGRERDDSVQARRDAAPRRGRADRGGRRRREHDRDPGRAVDRHEHRRGRLPGAAAQADPDLAGVRAVILGAGGAARAASGWRFAAKGRTSRSRARRPEAARLVAHAIGADVAAWPPAPGSWDLLVNATPVGSAAHRGEAPFAGPSTARSCTTSCTTPTRRR